MESKAIKEPSFLKIFGVLVGALILDIAILVLIYLLFVRTCVSYGEFSEIGCGYRSLYFWFLGIPIVSVIIIPMFSVVIYKLLNK